MTCVLIRGENRDDTERRTPCEDREHTEGRWPCEGRGRNWSKETVSQGAPRIAGNHQGCRKGKERFFLRAFGGGMDYSALISDL